MENATQNYKRKAVTKYIELRAKGYTPDGVANFADRLCQVLNVDPYSMVPADIARSKAFAFWDSVRTVARAIAAAQ